MSASASIVPVPQEDLNAIVEAATPYALEEALGRVFVLKNVVYGQGKAIAGKTMLKDNYDASQIYLALLRVFRREQRRNPPNLNMLWFRDGKVHASDYILDNMFPNASWSKLVKEFKLRKTVPGFMQQEACLNECMRVRHEGVDTLAKEFGKNPTIDLRRLSKGLAFSPGPFITNLPFDMNGQDSAIDPIPVSHVAATYAIDESDDFKNPKLKKTTTAWAQVLVKVSTDPLAVAPLVAPAAFVAPPSPTSIASVSSRSESQAAPASPPRAAAVAPLSSSSSSAPSRVGRLFRYASAAMSSAVSGLVGSDPTQTELEKRLYSPLTRGELETALEKVFRDFEKVPSVGSKHPAQDTDVDRGRLANVVVGNLREFLPYGFPATYDFLAYRRRLWTLTVGSLLWEKQQELFRLNSTTVDTADDDAILDDIEAACREWIDTVALNKKLADEKAAAQEKLTAPIRAQITAHEKTIKDLQVQVGRAAAELQAAIENRASDATTHAAQNNILQQDVAYRDGQIATFSSENARLTKDLDDAERELVKFRSNAVATTNLENEIANLKVELASERATSSSSTTEILNLRSTISILNGKIARLEIDVSDLKAALATANAALAAASAPLVYPASQQVIRDAIANIDKGAHAEMDAIIAIASRAGGNVMIVTDMINEIEAFAKAKRTRVLNRLKAPPIAPPPPPSDIQLLQLYAMTF